MKASLTNQCKQFLAFPWHYLSSLQALCRTCFLLLSSSQSFSDEKRADITPILVKIYGWVLFSAVLQIYGSWGGCWVGGDNVDNVKIENLEFKLFKL